MQERDMPKPWYVVAHSMGAAILLSRLPERGDPFLRAAVLSPMLALSRDIAPGYAQSAVTALAKVGLGRAYVPGGGPSSIATLPFENNRLSNDLARYERNAAILAAAPDLGIGAPTIGWLAAAFAAMTKLVDPAIPRKISTPLLILASGADRVVATAAAEGFAARLKTGEAIVIRGARHELLMESDIYREQALAALNAFIPGGDRTGFAAGRVSASA
jgi:lysophospholipase